MNISKNEKVLIFLLVITFTLTISACDIIGPDGNGSYEYTIDSAIAYIEDSGFEVKNRTGNFHDLIGAEDGANIDVGEDKISVELYIDGGDIQKSMFENPDDGAQAFSIYNLYIYIHTEDTGFYEDLKAVFVE